jgi:Zn-dependent peptidase ImmA (M78 family)
MAAVAGDEHVVVLNAAASNERSRLNAAHELGHCLYGDCKVGSSENHGPTEDRAFEFASHFLLTDDMLEEAFRDRSIVSLVKYKERFGISIAAMVYRAERKGILSKKLAKHLWIEFNRRGWRTREPGNVKEDRATRFEQLLDGAILQQKISWQTAAQLTGVREDELRQRVELAVGVNEPPTPQARGGDKTPFMRLVK